MGKRVRIQVGEKVIEGILAAVPADRKQDTDRPTYPTFASLPPPGQSNLALISTSTGTVAVNKNNVSWAEFEGSAGADYTTKEKVKRFRFKVTGAKAKVPVTVAYLQKAISWSPAYLVELIDDKKARITMQGLLMNDVEDVEGVDVYFVVGFPNFVFADTMSPLALTQSVAEFVEGLGREQPRRRYDITAQQSVAYGYGGGYGGPAGPPGETTFGYSSRTETPGAPEEDLFLYQMKDVSLKKGERAYYTVFSAEVPYEHVYEWTIPDTSNVRSDGYVENSERNEGAPAEDQVWHKLRLTNESKFPWTTAPGMAMSKGQPLSQDTLAYTPKGAKGDLKLTIATDIKAKKAESERSREDARITSYSFSKVTADGTLTVKNFKSQPVTVMVKKTLVGGVVSADQGGRVDKTAVGLKAVNPTSVISWELPLKSGEEKTLAYTYITYIRF